MRHATFSGNKSCHSVDFLFLIHSIFFVLSSFFCRISGSTKWNAASNQKPWLFCGKFSAYSKVFQSKWTICWSGKAFQWFWCPQFNASQGEMIAHCTSELERVSIWTRKLFKLRLQDVTLICLIVNSRVDQNECLLVNEACLCVLNRLTHGLHRDNILKTCCRLIVCEDLS